MWGGHLERGYHTFFGHRQIRITAGFAGSNHLLEQSPLEIWWLKEGENHQNVETTYYILGGSAVGHRSRTYQDQRGFQSSIPKDNHLRCLVLSASMYTSSSCWDPGCLVQGPRKRSKVCDSILTVHIVLARETH